MRQDWLVAPLVVAPLFALEQIAPPPRRGLALLGARVQSLAGALAQPQLAERDRLWLTRDHALYGQVDLAMSKFPF